MILKSVFICEIRGCLFALGSEKQVPPLGLKSSVGTTARKVVAKKKGSSKEEMTARN